ncbi:Potassium voltage-gated channel subfamily G member 2 [Intoshia linei]|uniref:Potassium voltage-gated channel subfamily G member 2 n=1 Tax=Intoshia linei TaxID=1819745 RepID=A0A177AWF6_9BILA|nr:Potassium voltage-gated channel subfamily G member 2 [Intoshia linei]
MISSINATASSIERYDFTSFVGRRPTFYHYLAKHSSVFRKNKYATKNISKAPIALICTQESHIHDCIKLNCHRVIINIGGLIFETQRSTLDRFPNTLLGNPSKMQKYWDQDRNLYYFARHRPTFSAILYFYQSGGNLRRPIEVPEEIFYNELIFFEFDFELINQFKEKEGLLVTKETLLPQTKVKRTIWLMTEEPTSSLYAKVFALISVLMIVVSIVNFCIETIPSIRRNNCIMLKDREGKLILLHNYYDHSFIIETVCISWFVLELLLRLYACPSRLHFLRNVMNMFDFLAVVPYFISLISNLSSFECSEDTTQNGSLLVVRVLRIVRIFKLSKHSEGLRILGLTIKTSLRELGMFFFFLLVAMVIFSSAAYYADIDEPNSKLTSIPESFWWAIVTMTTVGYGDVTPVGIWGKMVGAVCVIAGVLTIALPVPVVVANFNNFYRHDKKK